MQNEKEQKDKLNAVKALLIYGEESGIKIRSREESHYSESKTPTAHHRTLVYSKDSRRIDPLHRSPGRGKKGACLLDWEERIQLLPRITIVVGEVPK
ncbi:hypothetical protein Tco_1039260 [Tanacetum coccineum]